MANAAFQRWISKYKVLEPIAQIGNGRYVLAEHLESKAKCMIKTLDLDDYEPEEAEEIRKTFKSEIALLQRVCHPNIVQFRDAFLDGDYHLVLDYVPVDKTLEERVTEKPLRLTEAIRYSVQICKALEHLHQSSTIHGNINPFNIALKGDSIVLFDLISALTTLPPSQTTMWEMRYIAPEVLTGKYDTGSDLFGLGHTLAYLISGKHPEEFKRNKHKLEYEQKAFRLLFNDLTRSTPSMRLKDATIARLRLSGLWNSIISKEPSDVKRSYYSITNKDDEMKLWEYCRTLEGESSTADAERKFQSIRSLLPNHHWDIPWKGMTDKHFLELGTLGQAEQLIENKDYARAANLMLPLAKDGVAWAQNNIGVLYETGEGVSEQNYAEAIRWYSLAAEQNSCTALENLGVIHQEDSLKDEAKSLEYFARAADLRLNIKDDAPSMVVGVTYDWTGSWSKEIRKGSAQGRTRLSNTSD